MDECIVWAGGKSSAGYGETWVNKRVTLVHRWAYEQAHGPIPPGGVIHHLCHNRACYNVAHLHLCANQAEHVRLDHTGRHYAKAQARLTCKHGHPWTEANIYLTPAGERTCRECRRNWKQSHRHTAMSAASAQA